MILDTMNNCEKYYCMHPLFEKAFEFLRSDGLADLAAGRHEIEGDALYASVVKDMGKGKDATKAKPEAHRKYIDIQLCLGEGDVIGWADLKDVQGKSLGYDAEKDLEFFDAKPATWMDVPGGSYAIYFPEDIHAPNAADHELHKVVVKIAVQ